MEQSFSERNNYVNLIENNEYDSNFRRSVVTSYFNQYNSLENGKLFERLKNIMDLFGIKQSQDFNDKMVFVQNKENTLEYFQKCPWNKIFDFAEYAMESDDDRKDQLADKYNQLFRFNGCKYRVVNYKVIPVMSDIEIEELKRASMTGIEEVDSALNDALILLSDKVNPNYNAVIAKASNALESMVLYSTRDYCSNEKTLSKALNKAIESGYVINDNFKEIIKKTYNYACNPGIRHGGENSIQATEEDAFFVLSICSACINYLNK